MPKMQACHQCRARFAARAGAAYCSPACRQRAYRRRNRPDPGVDPSHWKQAVKLLSNLLQRAEGSGTVSITADDVKILARGFSITADVYHSS
jgi:hypothetical protein